MKSKLNPVFILVALFIFKIAVIDQYRFKHKNTGDKRIAQVDLNRPGLAR